ncbi:MAG: helix-turn-helix domain-containing protein [Candidatus Poseidoniaceae archaeon]|nr:helix-turn-helix domain-containing protein [Candidatus Poseidoniaceae archaeon]
MTSQHTRYVQINLKAEQGQSLPGRTLMTTFQKVEFLSSLERSSIGTRCYVSIDYEDPKTLETEQAAMKLLNIIHQSPKNAVCEVLLTGPIGMYFASQPELWWAAPSFTHPEGMRLTIRGTTGALRKMRTDLEHLLIDGYELKLGSESEFHPEFVDFLPQRQTVVLNTAIGMGYYDRPRRCTQREIADELNLKQATISEHLQSAEAAIIHRYSSDLGKN